MKNKRKFIVAVLSVCVIATTIFAASPDIAQAASKTKYYSGMPKAIGVMELSDKQITSLSKSKDIQKLADKINTVADCVRYFKKCKFKFYGSEDSGAGFLKKRKGDDFGSTRAFAYLLANDYDEIGTIYMRHKTIDDFKYLLYVKTGDKYYAVDPSQYLQNYVYNSKFMGNYTGKNFYSSTLKGLKSKLVKGLGSKYKVAETEVISKISDDMLYYNHKFINIRAGLDKKKVEAGLDKLTEAEYTYDELEQMIQEDDTLDAYAEKLRTAEDIVRVLKLKHYADVKYSNSMEVAVVRYVNGEPVVTERGYKGDRVGWVGNINAQTAFDRNSGSCGSTSNLVNYILRNDFEEQGYVQFFDNQGGHIFNYFIIDGLYYFCDFIGIPGTGKFRDYADDKYYIFYVTDDPFDFKEWYINDSFFSESFADENSSGFLRVLYMYPYEGTRIPCGTWDKHPTKFGNDYWEVRPLEAKEIDTILYIRDDYPLEYLKIPDKSLWPKELL